MDNLMDNWYLKFLGTFLAYTVAGLFALYVLWYVASIVPLTVGVIREFYKLALNIWDMVYGIFRMVRAVLRFFGLGSKPSEIPPTEIASTDAAPNNEVRRVTRVRRIRAMPRRRIKTPRHEG